MNITNPILRTNPDPSIVRTGDDYYIATSTFEWHPWRANSPLQRPTVHWRLLTRPLQGGASQLDDAWAIRIPAASGPPCLTYADGLFYLVVYGRETLWPGFGRRHGQCT